MLKQYNTGDRVCKERNPVSWPEEKDRKSVV